VNLAGAVLGVGIAGFLLMPTVGLWGTILAGATLNVAAGLAVLALPALERVPEEERDEPASQTGPTSRLLLAAAFFSGVISLASQVAWTRVLVLIVGSTTYAFTTVLLVYLIALAAGSIWASRRGTRVREVAPHLAVAHLVMALGMVIAIYTVDSLPYWYLAVMKTWQPASISGRVAVNLGIIFTVLFLPVLFAGMIFPLTMIGAVPPGERHTGSAVGKVYAINTVGAILGAIAGGFILVPLLGSQRTLFAMTLIGVALGVVFALRSERRWLALGAPVVAVIVGVAALTMPAWQQKPLLSTVYERAVFQDAAELQDPQQEILYYREGQTATVAVNEYR
jgi:spermidine synthase